MSKIEQYSRIINHAISTNGAVFTVPTSNDHTDETWLATDLYVGELGVNVTDDKVYVRTSNGIVQLSTGSTGSSAGSGILVFNSPNIQIAATYSANSLSPNGTYYTDLGTTSNRWKDLLLGGSSTTIGTINSAGGLVIRETTDYIMSTNAAVSSNAPIEIDGSSNVNKDRTLNLNSRSVTNTGSTNYNTTIASQTVSMTNNSKAVVIAGSNVTLLDGISNVVHLGKGYSKTSYESDQVTVGGSLAVRGTDDDGSTQYYLSDWTTKQSRLRTSNALMNDLATISWSDPVSGGDVIQIKAHVVASDIYNATLVYSAEISGVYSIDAGLTLSEIGTPIVLEWDSFVQNGYAIPTVEIGSDGDGVYVKAQGNSTSTIQWLCTYSYHRLVNVI
jgi:hypothetical protein